MPYVYLEHVQGTGTVHDFFQPVYVAGFAFLTKRGFPQPLGFFPAWSHVHQWSCIWPLRQLSWTRSNTFSFLAWLWGPAQGQALLTSTSLSKVLPDK